MYETPETFLIHPYVYCKALQAMLSAALCRSAAFWPSLENGCAVGVVCRHLCKLQHSIGYCLFAIFTERLGLSYSTIDVFSGLLMPSLQRDALLAIL